MSPSKTAKTTNVTDLDKKRAARNEQNPEPHAIVLGGEKFVLPLEMPLDIIEPLMDVQTVQGTLPEDPKDMKPEQQVAMIHALQATCTAILGEADYKRFRSVRPSLEDYQAFVDASLAAYGLSEGESGASAES